MNPHVVEALNKVDPEIGLLVLALILLASLVGVFAATVEWLWLLWKGRKK